jgi:glycine dehydrogenase
MMRYIRNLERKDIGPRHVDDSARLVHDEAERGVRDAADHVAGVRPAPIRSLPWNRPPGYREVFADLERMLAEISGFAGVSLAAELGRAGEFAG